MSVTIRRPSADEKTLDACRDEGLFDATVWRRSDGLDSALEDLPVGDRNLVRCLEERDWCTFFERAVTGKHNIAVSAIQGLARPVS
ncbi:hypothetical protein NO135_21915, partial [Clostridioides difficile]|nr:hypothetical protein [Clostridioides difficile]